MTRRLWKVVRITAATDFSRAGGHAVERAAALAKALGAELRLAHVSPSPAFDSLASHLLAALGGAAYSSQALGNESLERLRRPRAVRAVSPQS